MPSYNIVIDYYGSVATFERVYDVRGKIKGVPTSCEV